MIERSWIVHGPQGCGKSEHARAIARALGVWRIRDNWDGRRKSFRDLDTLHLVQKVPDWLSESEARRCVSFEHAMVRVRELDHADPNGVTGDVVDAAAAVCTRVIGPTASKVRRAGGDAEVQRYLMCVVALTLSMARDRLGIAARAMAAEACGHLEQAVALTGAPVGCQAAEGAIVARVEAEPVETCRVCGCTDERACPGGCYWAAPGLCSSCGVNVKKIV